MKYSKAFSRLIEHLPLKQGLRRITVENALEEILIDHLPLKQGLRLPSPWEYLSADVLIEHLPLKQGLRPASAP